MALIHRARPRVLLGAPASRIEPGWGPFSRRSQVSPGSRGVRRCVFGVNTMITRRFPGWWPWSRRIQNLAIPDRTSKPRWRIFNLWQMNWYRAWRRYFLILLFRLKKFRAYISYRFFPFGRLPGQHDRKLLSNGWREQPTASLADRLSRRSTGTSSLLFAMGHPRSTKFGGHAHLNGRVVQIHEITDCEFLFFGASVVVALVGCVRFAAMVPR